MNIDISKLDHTVLARYEQSRAPSASVVRAVSHRLKNSTNPPLSSAAYQHILDTQGHAAARIASDLNQDGAHFETPLTSLLDKIEHHAASALSEDILQFDYGLRMSQWHGCKIKQVHDIYAQILEHLRNRINAACGLAQLEVDPTGEFARQYDIIESRYKEKLAQLAALPAPKGVKARQQRIKDYEIAAQQFRYETLPWFKSFRDILCFGGRDNRWEALNVPQLP